MSADEEKFAQSPIGRILGAGGSIWRAVLGGSLVYFATESERQRHKCIIDAAAAGKTTLRRAWKRIMATAHYHRDHYLGLLYEASHDNPYFDPGGEG